MKENSELARGSMYAIEIAVRLEGDCEELCFNDRKCLEYDQKSTMKFTLFLFKKKTEVTKLHSFFSQFSVTQLSIIHKTFQKYFQTHNRVKTHSPPIKKTKSTQPPISKHPLLIHNDFSIKSSRFFSASPILCRNII